MISNIEDLRSLLHPCSLLLNSGLTCAQDYAREYVRLSLLGVNNINSLTECTHVLPRRILTAKTDDNNAAIQKWLKGEKNQLSSVLEEGDPVPNVARRHN